MYGALRFSADYTRTVTIDKETRTGTTIPIDRERKQKLVVLYSNQRSGSSFMGEYFNRNPEAFYLYEPLFPFTPRCDFLNEERIRALENMLQCNFSQVREVYEHAIHVRHPKQGRGEKPCGTICFPTRSEAIQRRLKIDARNNTHKKWRPSIDERFLSHLCKESTLITYKILRICNLRDMDYIYKRLALQGKQLYVIHLLRDPRAIISSKLQLELKQHEMETRVKTLCAKMERNLKIVGNTSGIFRDCAGIRRY